jgi:hypothetical protein
MDNFKHITPFLPARMQECTDGDGGHLKKAIFKLDG